MLCIKHYTMQGEKKERGAGYEGARSKMKKLKKRMEEGMEMRK